MERNKNAIMANQSTEKALKILEYLSAYGRPMRLIDISEELCINPSTTSRFLSAFVNCGYVTQDKETQRYSMTYKICRIAAQVTNDNDLKIQRITHPYLEKVSAIFHESVCVSIEREMQMVYIDVVTGRGKTLMSRQKIGNTSPMHCTGNGKLCLLNYTEDQLDQYIEKKGLTKFTNHTIVTKKDLMERLDDIRKKGYAYDNEECEEGMRCLAYPIYDYSGKIIGGLSITGPKTRLSTEILLPKQKQLEKIAKEISVELGYSQKD